MSGGKRDWDDAERETVRARLGALVAGLPGVELQDGHGHTGYALKGKRFAWCLVDHHGDGRLALWAKAPAGEQQALVGGYPERYSSRPTSVRAGGSARAWTSRPGRTGTRSPACSSRPGG